MGISKFFRQASDFISGGAAIVQVEFNKTYYLHDDEIKLKVTAQTKERDFYVNRIYVNIKGEEKTKVNISTGKSTHTETKKFISFRLNKDISEGQAFMANEYYEWTCIFTLSTNVLPTYYGKHAQHKWFARAGLDVTGKDPISKWTEFIVFENKPAAHPRF